MDSSTREMTIITVGVLALQGAFNEHTQLLRQAAQILASKTLHHHHNKSWIFLEVRSAAELDRCDALIIPGGESTAISLVAQRSNLLEPLRDFVKTRRKPTWGTCAGLILLAESASRSSSSRPGGKQELLIGGLDVHVDRNHFGRQRESFQTTLDLPFLREAAADGASLDTGGGGGEKEDGPFRGIFIRAPIVERLLPVVIGGGGGGGGGVRGAEARVGDAAVVVVAPSRERGMGEDGESQGVPVEILARLPGRAAVAGVEALGVPDAEAGDIVAVRQGNVFGTSFHPELTGDPRIHVWWLEQVSKAFDLGLRR